MTDHDGDEMECGLEEVLEALASVGLALPAITTETTLYRDICTAAHVVAALKGDAGRQPAGGGPSAALMSTLREIGDLTTLGELQRQQDRKVADEISRNSGLPLRPGTGALRRRP